MAINLGDYWKARALKLPARGRDGELQNLNWTLKSAVDGRSCSEILQEPSPRLPDNFEGTDIHALMQRLRALANQI
ncbi:MAG: hypothetical protein OEP48_05570 [Betaproteobacteria bacterium]|nr:hypothetical protein [Betaproteobacteria bacterium]MDH3435976.1 hypothetical protein [Betaproteobacteria bacterium]